MLRCYLAAEFGRQLTNTTFIVALPADDDPETSSVGRMRDELVMRGIPAESIRMEFRGLNTRQQAANVRALLGDDAVDEPLVVVSSQYHVRRAARYFRKAGFTNVSGLTAHSVSAEAAIGPGACWLRYRVWNNAVAWVRISRELVALTVSLVR